LMRRCSTNVGQSSSMSGAFLIGRCPPEPASVSTAQVTSPAPQDDNCANGAFRSRIAPRPNRLREWGDASRSQFGVVSGPAPERARGVAPKCCPHCTAIPDPASRI
jgi:hypothetical protein